MAEQSNQGAGRPGSKVHVFELAAFLFLFVPSIILSYFSDLQEAAGFTLVALETIAYNLALVLLIAFFLWRNGEPPVRLGWSRRRPWAEAALGFLLFPPFVLFVGLIEGIFLELGLTAPLESIPPFLAASGAQEYALALILVLVVAVTEETIYRGYLILRFTAVTNSRAAAVLCSTAVFSLGHGYQGSAGMATVAVIGLFFCFVYLWRKSLIAPMVLHFLQDFVGIIIYPLLGPG
jgi:membrane protease YdiL (CAAX protease family)